MGAMGAVSVSGSSTNGDSMMLRVIYNEPLLVKCPTNANAWSTEANLKTGQEYAVYPGTSPLSRTPYPDVTNTNWNCRT